MKSLLLALALTCILIGGCSFLQHAAPSALDEQGNPIPGTHELAQPYKDVAGHIPYGETILLGLVGAWNLYERFKKNKYKKGLVATVKAIEAAGEDPATKADIDELKASLAVVHDAANVTKVINDILAAIKYGKETKV